MAIKKSGYSEEILKFLYSNHSDEEVPMTRMQEIITSYYSITNAVENLSKEGLVKKRDVIQGRKTIMVSLTDKGRQVAEQLLNADLAAKGTLKKSFFSRSQLILMFLGRVGKATVPQIKDEIPGSYDDLKELEEMKLITQKIEETKGKKENYTTLTGKGEEMAKELEKCEDIVKR